MRTRALALLLAATLAPACRREPPQPAPVVVVPEAATILTLADASGSRTLHPGDVVDTGPAGPTGLALLRLPDGRTLALQPDSRIRIKKANAGEIGVEIEKGVVLSRVPPQLTGQAIALDILTPLGIVHVPNTEHESTITVGAENVSVAVALGEIDFLDRQGNPTHARAAERVEVSLGGIEVLSTTATPQPAAVPLARTPRPGGVRRGPEVTLPPTRGLRIYSDALAQVNLTWPADLRDPLVEVASDAKFEKLTLTAHPTSPSLRVPAPRRGQLFWRISGLSGGARRTLLGQARFLPDRAKSLLDLAHPRNLVAETGQVTTVYFQSVLPALTFSYAGKSGAASYRVQIFRAGDLQHPVHTQQAKQTTCALAAGVLGEGSYLWHAVALDGGGQEVSGGLMNKLEILYDNPLNTLAIGSPKPGEAVTGAEVEVVGAAPMGSRLFVNGQAVPLDAKGRFEVRIDTSPSLVFRLVAQDGSESYWVRQLRTRS